MNSFIDAIITHMSNARVKKSGEPTKTALIAQRVQEQQHPNVLNRIAMTYVSLSHDRALAKAANQQPTLKPEHLVSFVQNAANQVCWAARRYARSQELQEADDQANGLDFSQDVAAQLNVEPMSARELADAVEQDAFCLGNVYLYLAGKMSYLEDLPEFSLFQESGPVIDEGTGEVIEWLVTATADTLDGARSLMDMAVERLNTEQIAKDGEEAQTADFGALSTDAVQAKTPDPMAKTLAALETKHPKPAQRAKKPAAKKPAAKKPAKSAKKAA